MTTVLSYLAGNPKVTQVCHYEFATHSTELLRDIHNYPSGTLVTVDEDVSDIQREFNGAQVVLSNYKQVYPLSVCFKFVNEVSDHFILYNTVADQDLRKDTKVIINKADCNELLTDWIDLRPLVTVGQCYKLSLAKGNNLAKVIVKYGIIRDEVINHVIITLINKYHLAGSSRNNLILQNEDALTNAITKDHIDIVKYLAPKVIPTNAEFTPYQAESALRTAVTSGAINACRYILETYKIFNEIDTCLKIAAQNANTDMLSLLFLHKMKHDKGRSVFNLDIRDGLNP